MAFGRRKKGEATGGKVADERIRVTTDSTRPVLDPSEPTLRELVLRLARGPEDFVSVGRGPESRGVFVQVMVRPDGGTGRRCGVEARDGTDESHVHAIVPDLDAAADVVVLWAAGDPAWRQVAPWAEGYVP